MGEKFCFSKTEYRQKIYAQLNLPNVCLHWRLLWLWRITMQSTTRIITCQWHTPTVVLKTSGNVSSDSPHCSKLSCRMIPSQWTKGKLLSWASGRNCGKKWIIISTQDTAAKMQVKSKWIASPSRTETHVIQHRLKSPLNSGERFLCVDGRGVRTNAWIKTQTNSTLIPDCTYQSCI